MNLTPINNPAQRLKELDEERSKLLDSAKNEALARAEQAVSDLRALGFMYSLSVDGPKPARIVKGKPSAKGVKGGVAAKPCQLCKFLTDPPHDRRKHRFHPKAKKRAFNAAELTELALKKVN